LHENATLSTAEAKVIQAFGTLVSAATRAAYESPSALANGANDNVPSATAISILVLMDSILRGLRSFPAKKERRM